METLAGARIRRVDLPAPDLLALSLATPDHKEVLVISLDERVRGIGLVSERPRGEPASAIARKLRKEIENALLVAAERSSPDRVRIRCRRGEMLRTLDVDLSRDAPDVRLLDDTDRVIASLRPASLRARGIAIGDAAPPWDAEAAPLDPSELRLAGPPLVERRGESARDRRVAGLRRAIRTAAKRIERKIAAIESDAARAAECPDLRAQADLILANLHQIGPRDREVTATDWHADPPRERTVAIDPELGARGQAEQLFRRARRLERGVAIASERARAAREELAKLVALEAGLDASPTDDAVAAIAERAIALRVRGAREAIADESAARRRGDRPERVPYKRFAASGDRDVLVGKSAADNDALTLKHTRPHDLWLHVRGHSGSHVVVPLAKDESCPPDLLVDAATLAAWFSSARGETIVDVAYTPRRFVRKPRGAPPGSVMVDREKVIVLRFERDRLDRLLARERDPG